MPAEACDPHHHHLGHCSRSPSLPTPPSSCLKEREAKTWKPPKGRRVSSAPPNPAEEGAAPKGLHGAPSPALCQVSLRTAPSFPEASSPPLPTLLLLLLLRHFRRVRLCATP